MDPKLPEAKVCASEERILPVKTSLFRVVTERDEIIVGFAEVELAALGASDAPSLPQAMVAKATLPAWQYAVGRRDGVLVHAAQSRVGLLAHGSLRIEPYVSAYDVIPPTV